MRVKSIDVGALGTVLKVLEKGPEQLEIEGRISIVKIGQITQKSPGDLRRLAVTHKSSPANAGVKNSLGVIEI